MMTMEEKKYPVIGENPKEGQQKKAWEIPIKDLKTINPIDYYITTGEAIIKLDKLIEDAQSLLKEARKLKKSMEKSKGSSKYLETCWENGMLLCKRKDPRKKK